MADKTNWQEAADVGQDKSKKDFTEHYDGEHGKYEESKGGKPTSGAPGTLPNTPSPFTLGK